MALWRARSPLYAGAGYNDNKYAGVLGGPMQAAVRERTHPNPSVLVVDDDPPLVRMLCLTLREGGFDVRSAVSGTAALSELQSAPPDAIVLDLEMPGMSGQAFYREMRRRGFDIPVIIVSASGGGAARRELGAAASLDKPFDPDDLVRSVRGLLPPWLQ
jgi:DNA-binding response OmpR family regulator